ncbi:MAG: Ger(x)C family spore germination C-terminal domain-containing protein [Clostridia bacterium]|nr:Ger(x)C family spore germination C-terminal domain-containing protein [Clostridia bacterium]
MDSNTNYIAGETPVDINNNIENVGIAVFNTDKLVGELTSIESICHLIVSNKLESCIINITNPFDNTSVLDLEITPEKRTKTSVDIINGSPFIQTDIFLNCKIYNIDENSNYSNAENLEKIRQSANSYLTNEINNYLYKTSKVFNSDIDNFNGVAIRPFRTWQDWENYNWIANYKNSFFKVNVTTYLLSSYILLSS